MKKRSLKNLIALVIIISALMFRLSPAQNDVMSEGEELSYTVSYGFIEFGRVQMKVVSKKTENGRTIFTASSTMKSYKGIPFVNLSSTFLSEMVWDGKELYSRRFKATEYKDEGNVVIEYKFNYDSNYVFVKKETLGRVEREENISINPSVKFQDGLSVFYSSRIHSFSSDDRPPVPVFMNEAETTVNYYFSSMPDSISISIVDEDISTVRCNGVANFTGVFGLTGEFAGWFTNDRARVPVKAQMNVVIGNIVLELESYDRKGWKLK